MKKVVFEVAATQCGVMDARDHFKNRANLKKHLKNTHKSFRKFAAVSIAAICLLQGVWANSAIEIASIINTAAYGDLIATVDGNSVTVTGNHAAVVTSEDFLKFSINEGVTVIWQATLTGAITENFSLININGGGGIFEMQSGNIQNSGNGSTINFNSTGSINISDGTVSTTNGYAIWNATYTGVVNVSGGTVSATEGIAIFNYVFMTQSGGTVNVSGGTVSASTGYAISAYGTITVSGGEVSASTGVAIRASNITVSDNARITSASSEYTITGFAINVNDGGVENTADGDAIRSNYLRPNGRVNVLNGTVKSENGDAIRGSGYITISGGTIESVNGSAIAGSVYGTTASSPYGAIIMELVITGGILQSENKDAIRGELYNDGYEVPGSLSIDISGGTLSTNGNEKSAVYTNNGTVTLTGGSLSASSSSKFAVYGEEDASIVLGGSPDITGNLFVYPEKLSVLTSDPDAFDPESRIYTLDFVPEQYVAGKIAVVDGADFLNNFALLNANFVLSTDEQHLVIANIRYPVVYDLNGGGGVAPSESAQEQGAIFAAAQITGITAPAGQQFQEWNTRQNGTGTGYQSGASVTMPGEALTLFAIWEDLPKYAINIGAFEGGSVTSSAAESEAGTTITLTIAPDTDYELESISVHKTDDETINVPLTDAEDTRTFTMPDYDVTVVATFIEITPEPVLYTVTFSVVGGNGSISATVDGEPVASGEPVEEGKSVVFTAVPSQNYQVKEWKLNDNVVGDKSATYTLPDLQADATVTVAFDKLTDSPELAPAHPLRAWMRNGLLHVTGIVAGEILSIYNASGALVYQSIATTDEMDIPLTTPGVYIVRSGNRTARVAVQ